nr:YaiI/YqxD family protein [Aureimonas endophytica]
MPRMRRLFIDADACPVKEDAHEIAGRHGVEVVLVSNGGIRPSRFPGARVVTVAAGADEADHWIVEQAAAGDIVLTADIPLAARALERGAEVLNADGRSLTTATIGTALSMRAFQQHLRETGESKGYNRSFSPADRSRFRQALDRLLRRES